MATDYSTYVYPELVGYRSRDREVPPPPVPDTCPICGANKLGAAAAAMFVAASYACGGKYELKPQIQNHTDYYWGTCPPAERASTALQALNALKVIALCVETKAWLEANDPQALRQVTDAIRRTERVFIK